jgi:hypothetical protein
LPLTGLTPFLDLLFHLVEGLTLHVDLHLWEVAITSQLAQRLAELEPDPGRRLALRFLGFRGQVEQVGPVAEGEGFRQLESITALPAERHCDGIPLCNLDLRRRRRRIVNRAIIDTGPAPRHDHPERQPVTAADHLVERTLGPHRLAILFERETLDTAAAAAQHRLEQVRIDCDSPLGRAVGRDCRGGWSTRRRRRLFRRRGGR